MTISIIIESIVSNIVTLKNLKILSKKLGIVLIVKEKVK